MQKSRDFDQLKIPGSRDSRDPVRAWWRDKNPPRKCRFLPCNCWTIWAQRIFVPKLWSRHKKPWNNYKRRNRAIHQESKQLGDRFWTGANKIVLKGAKVNLRNHHRPHFTTDTIFFWRFARAGRKGEINDGGKPKHDFKWKAKSSNVQSVWKGRSRHEHKRSHWSKPFGRILASMQRLWKEFQVKISIVNA